MIRNVDFVFGMIGDVNFDFDFGVIGPSTLTSACLCHWLRLWHDQAIDVDFSMIGNVNFDFSMIGDVNFHFRRDWAINYNFGVIGPAILA